MTKTKSSEMADRIGISIGGCINTQQPVEKAVKVVEAITNRKWKDAFIHAYTEASYVKKKLVQYQTKYDQVAFYIIKFRGKDKIVLDVQQFHAFDFMSSGNASIEPTLMTLLEAEKIGYDPGANYLNPHDENVEVIEKEDEPRVLDVNKKTETVSVD